VGSKKGKVFSPSDAVETFPFLEPTEIARLDKLGREYLQARHDVMTDPANPIGLTKLYNRFHNAGDGDQRIERLRELHREIDAAVMRAYGWDDIDLGHGHHEQPNLAENDSVRFTISDSARAEVLRRFAELNRQRYAEEVAQGLHDGKATGTATRKSHTETTPVQQSSFGFDVAPANEGHYLKAAEPRADYRSGLAHAIVEYLKARPGWHAKSDILAATRITDGQWNAATADLISGGKVERQGERRGARYRFLVGEEK